MRGFLIAVTVKGLTMLIPFENELLKINKLAEGNHIKISSN